MDVAIIGAGLSGLALALALHQQGIKARIFESRSAPLNIGGAVMLSPNALRILDRLDLYTQVKNQGYNFDTLEFRTTDDELIDTYTFGDEVKYGYRANRIYRHELIDILLTAVRAAGIEVHYSHKLSTITSETSTSVEFSFTNDTTGSASMLIGADGIHSTVRKHLYPSPTHAPRFIGQAGITASVPTRTTQITKPLTIISPTQGAFVVAPQKVDGSELLIGKQKRIPGNPSREEWDAIHADKTSSIEFLQQNTDVFGPVAASCVGDIDPSRINVWPFFVVAKLERWTSVVYQRIVLVGDAAHAIPPSAGQGISQAMEDAYMLALLVKEVGARVDVDMGQAMAFWQRFRQDRVEKVLELNGRVDRRRLPRQEGQAEIEREEWDLGWLYDVDIERTVEQWIAKQVV